MRITCFVLGALCLLASAVWLGIGVLDIAGGGSTSSPTVANFGMAQTAADTTPNLDEFGPATTIAQVFAFAGIAWMVGAAAFAPRQAPATAATEQRQWQQPQQQQPQQYAPQWHQQAPAQHPDQQS